MSKHNPKVESDFKEVAKVILNECPPEFSRCHEMAYIVNRGMIKKGNDTVVKHGYYFDSFPLLSLLYKGYMDHSWVSDKSTGLILDAYCNRPYGPGGERIFGRPQFEIVLGRSEKAKYVPWKLKYTLVEGTQDFARSLFG
jgi:hypothetical protein